MKKSIFLNVFGIFLIFLTGCTTLNRTGWSRTNDTRQLYSIFCNYFTEKLTERRTESIVVSERTDFDHHIREIKENASLERLFLFLPALERSTLEDLLAENSSSSSIAAFDTKKRLIILSDEEEKAIFKTGRWDQFWKQYKSSQGIMTLSKIGFSNDRKQAILYYGNGCGEKCGAGGLAYFRFDGVEWKLELIFPMWIS
jgi:hypothetical protein